MSKKQTVAEVLWEMLVAAGVKRCYGIVGDAMNPIMDALRGFPEIEFIHVRNEEAGTFAANAESFVTGGPVAVCGTSGPGATHLVNGLFDALHERVPTIAIAGDVDSTVIGSGVVEEVDTNVAYLSCTLSRARIENPWQAGPAFRSAIDRAITERGPVLLSIPGDVAAMEYQGAPVGVTPQQSGEPVLVPSQTELQALADAINSAEKVTIFGGDGCRGAGELVVELAKKINAPVGYSWRGKAALEGDNPNDVGMSGLLGWGACYKAMHEADALLMLGTDWPFTTFYPSDVETYQVDTVPGHLGRHAPNLTQGFVGDVGDTIAALLPLIEAKTDRKFLDTCLKKTDKDVKRLNHYVERGPKMSPIRPEYLAATLNELADDDAAFTVDTGTAYIWSARYIKIGPKRSLFASASWASMANAMPNAMGIQLAQPDRQVIALCGDGGISMLLGELITIAERQLPVKLFVLHNNKLDFVNIEFQEAGLRPFGTDLWNPDFSRVADAIGLKGVRLDDPGTVRETVQEALDHDGPVLVDAMVDPNALAMPPHVNKQMVSRFGFSEMKQIMHGEGGNVVKNVEKNIDLI